MNSLQENVESIFLDNRYFVCIQSTKPKKTFSADVNCKNIPIKAI